MSVDKRSSRARFISDRDGKKYYMKDAIIEDGYLIHKKEADGQWSLLKHPLNNMGRYLRGKTGDPYPVPNARPDVNWAVSQTYNGQGLSNVEVNCSLQGAFMTVNTISSDFNADFNNDFFEVI